MGTDSGRLVASCMYSAGRALKVGGAILASLHVHVNNCVYRLYICNIIAVYWRKRYMLVCLEDKCGLFEKKVDCSRT
jgi:hypothetical protein